MAPPSARGGRDIASGAARRALVRGMVALVEVAPTAGGEGPLPQALVGGHVHAARAMEWGGGWADAAARAGSHTSLAALPSCASVWGSAPHRVGRPPSGRLGRSRPTGLCLPPPRHHSCPVSGADHPPRGFARLDRLLHTGGTPPAIYQYSSGTDQRGLRIVQPAGSETAPTQSKGWAGARATPSGDALCRRGLASAGRRGRLPA